MAGMTITNAMRWMKRKLDSTASRTVTVIAPGEAGGESIDGLDAVPVASNFVELVSDDYAVTAKDCDWIFQADELVFPLAGKREPADGWQIRYVREDGRTAVFVVRPNGAGRCFDVEDALGILVMVHSKLERVE